MAMITQPASPNTVPVKRLSRRPEVAEVALLRERLVIARVMNGFSVQEAQDRLGNQINLASIESGKYPFPKDIRFLKEVSEIYAVSVDFLLGHCQNADIDAAYSERYSLMRGFEAILKQQADSTKDAFLTYLSQQDKLCREQYQAISDSAHSLTKAVQLMREKYGFDELRGSATVLAAIERLGESLKPVRKALNAQAEIEKYCSMLAAGKIGPIAYLLDENSDIHIK